MEPTNDQLKAWLAQSKVTQGALDALANAAMPLMEHLGEAGPIARLPSDLVQAINEVVQLKQEIEALVRRQVR